MKKQKLNKKHNSRTYILVVISVVCTLIVLFIRGYKMFPLDAQAAEINANLSKISESISESLLTNLVNGLSSNPYDYIKDNESYDSIIALGSSALPNLEDALKSSTKDGLIEYIIAIAIEEIANTNIRSADDMFWETPKGFLSVWQPFVSSVSERVNFILSSEMDDSKKVEEMKIYGILALPELCRHMQVLERSPTLLEYARTLLFIATPEQHYSDSVKASEIVNAVENDLDVLINYVG